MLSHLFSCFLHQVDRLCVYSASFKATKQCRKAGQWGAYANLLIALQLFAVHRIVMLLQSDG